MPPRQARRRGGQTLSLDEVHALADNLQQHMQQQIDELTREVQRLRTEANNPPPRSRTEDSYGDSSSSESVQSFRGRRNAQHCIQNVRELEWEKEFLSIEMFRRITESGSLLCDSEVKPSLGGGVRSKLTNPLPITSWRKMEDKIRKYFLPKGYKRELYQRYQILRQGTRTVDEYTNEFNELVIRNTIQDPKEVLVNKYLNGLQLYIQDALEVLDIWDLGDAHQRACKVERSRSRRQQSSTMTSQTARKTTGTTKVAEATTQAASKSSTQPNNSKQPSTSNIPCYSCGELGHRASNCRVNKNRPAGKALMVDNDSDEHTEEALEEELNDDEEAAVDEQIVHADSG
ncbi:Acyl carrier protein [Psidium guajava]|nr:Acyl carrier protein [Psidium guajava]